MSVCAVNVPWLAWVGPGPRGPGETRHCSVSTGDCRGWHPTCEWWGSLQGRAGHLGETNPADFKAPTDPPHRKRCGSKAPSAPPPASSPGPLFPELVKMVGRHGGAAVCREAIPWPPQVVPVDGERQTRWGRWVRTLPRARQALAWAGCGGLCRGCAPMGHKLGVGAVHSQPPPWTVRSVLTASVSPAVTTSHGQGCLDTGACLSGLWGLRARDTSAFVSGGPSPWLTGGCLPAQPSDGRERDEGAEGGLSSVCS